MKAESWNVSIEMEFRAQFEISPVNDQIKP